MQTITTFDDLARISLLTAGADHPHIHLVDMPYRLSSSWQDQGCQLGIWEEGDEIIAWSVFQPPWWNLDVAMLPRLRGSRLEQEIFSWGKKQMARYAKRSGAAFWGSAEIFADAPRASATIANLEALGFSPFDWSIVRFELDASQPLPEAELPAGFKIRPSLGVSEIEAYVSLHRAAFGSQTMTAAWRKRIVMHPAYRSELDLVVENAQAFPVGFCVGWLGGNSGQIEPFGVHPDYQGLGLGRALEISACRSLRNHGAQVIKIDHASFNQTAIALSMGNGFLRRNNALRYYVAIDPV